MQTRAQALAALMEPTRWDVLVIGGGATGAGVAVDAASRGYRTLLLEQSDFGKGTSSRSTKLVHGGVRYLQQGNISLVMEALRERGRLIRNAPHLVHRQRFVIPAYRWWERLYYGLGMKVYGLLAWGRSLGPSRLLSPAAMIDAVPSIARDGLRGGVQYFDGQFDDARLVINLVQTAVERGATALNYCGATGLMKDERGRVAGVVVRDEETGETLEVSSRVVINATGAFCDGVRRMADGDAPAMIAPSQGVHIVLDQRFLPGDAALMVPKTRDGRVVFAIPWHGVTLVGTTDTPIDHAELEPRAQDEEVAFLLETVSGYLEEPPVREDIRAVFTGIRPLVRAGGQGGEKNTAKLSRDHTVQIGDTGLVTITGGKWTTYRHMAEDAVDQAAELVGLSKRACVTADLPIHGCPVERNTDSAFGASSVYGSDTEALDALIASDPGYAQPLHPDLPYSVGHVVWASRHEYARTVDDCLARRTRALILNARAAVDAAPLVVRTLADELGHDGAWARAQVEAFSETAAVYLPPSP